MISENCVKTFDVHTVSVTSLIKVNTYLVRSSLDTTCILLDIKTQECLKNITENVFLFNLNK